MLPEKLCMEIPTHLPSRFGQCRNPRVWWQGVREQCQGPGQWGTLTCGQKTLYVQLQLSNGPAAVLAQPSLKEMLGLCWLKKTKKIPRHFPCHFQKDTKAMGHVTQTFPIAF